MSAGAATRITGVYAGGDGMNKTPRATITVDAMGAQGDRHYGRSSARALLLVPMVVYDAISAHGIKLAPGSLGENLTVSGLPTELPAGTLLELGSTLVEVTGACTVCASLSVLDPRLPKLSYRRRGMYLKVRYGGPLNVEDPVRIVSPQSAAAWTPARHESSPRVLQNSTCA